MVISMNCKDFFDLNIVGIGNLEFDKEFDDEELKKNFMNFNAPAIMFPYVRAFISTLTSNLDSITGTLTILTQFFQGELPEITIDDTEDK